MRATTILFRALPIAFLFANSVVGCNSTLSSYTTTDGATYAYAYTPAQGSNATYLLLHGYPSSHKDWAAQISALSAAGYGTLAPDMLGFGASDKPTDPEEYRAVRLGNHLIELLDHEGVGNVIGVGHDWGSVVLSRVIVYHRERFDKIAFVDVGYQVPTGFVDIDAFNTLGLNQWGYMPYGYWYFFDRYDASTVIGNHLESFWHVVFPENHTVWENDLVPVGAARAWLNADIITEDAPFMTEAYKAEWLAWMSSPNAIEAGLNCYRSQLRGINDADERHLTDADRTLHVPVLAIGGRYDPIARAEIQIETTRAWAVGGFESVTLDGGHWLSIEKADEVSQLLLEFGGKWPARTG